MKELIAQNLSAIFVRVEAACARVARDPSEVQIIAVSKKQELDKMLAYQSCGKTLGYKVIFGENYLQEYEKKFLQLVEKSEVHFIGALQSNKAVDAVRLFDVIESVHSEKLALELNRQAEKIGKKQRIYLQVNISQDQAKAGFEDKLLESFVSKTLPSLSFLELAGLMTITRLYPQAEMVRPDFIKMRELRDRLQELPFIKASKVRLALSMGMSDDFEIAIEEGADIIRIGTLLFGSRSEGVIN